MITVWLAGCLGGGCTPSKRYRLQAYAQDIRDLIWCCLKTSYVSEHVEDFGCDVSGSRHPAVHFASEHYMGNQGLCAGPAL